MRIAAFLVLGVLSVLQHSHSVPLEAGRSGLVGKIRHKDLTFLIQYGYLPGSSKFNTNDITKAVVRFQRSYGLTPTGKVDHKTRRFMRKPRCGLTDQKLDANAELTDRQSSKLLHTLNSKSHHHPNTAKSRISSLSESISRRKKRYALVSRWPSTEVSYGFRSYTSSLSPVQQQNVISQALSVWSDDTPLTFSQKWREDADVMISFERGYHDDGYPFDGRGHTLAHAFYPGQGSRSGDVHFDEDEKWAYSDNQDGTSLFMVAVHEIGHALGLGHSNNSDSVMLPFYQAYKHNVRLGDDDIRAVYNLYGAGGLVRDFLDDIQPILADSPHTATSGQVVGRENKRSVTEGDQPISNCSYSFDAAANIRGGLYFFKGNHFWRIKKKGDLDSDVKMNRFWVGFPDDVTIDAVYARKGMIFIFSGTNYWVYKGTRLNGTYPKPISDFGLPMDEGGINAAFIWKANKQTYFIKGDKIWQYNEEKGAIERNYPKTMSKVLPGIPRDLDAAFSDPTDPDQAVYFLKGEKCWRLNDRDFTVSDMTIGERWFGCPPVSSGGQQGPKGAGKSPPARSGPLVYACAFFACLFSFFQLAIFSNAAP